MVSGRRWQILALITMAIIGVGFGIWLLRAGFITLGCLYIAVFLWRGQQFTVWFIAPFKARSDVTPPLSSTWQRLLLSIICLFGAAICAIGVYLWRSWPEQWQAGLVFVLFGLLVLAPVTMKEIQFRRKALAHIQSPAAK
jgi:multisubunit Na+/H+ antiporter MnhG subunit